MKKLFTLVAMAFMAIGANVTGHRRLHTMRVCGILIWQRFLLTVVWLSIALSPALRQLTIGSLRFL